MVGTMVGNMVGTMVGTNGGHQWWALWWAPMVWWAAGIGLIPDIIAANPPAHTITHPPGTELAQFPNGNDFKIKLFK